MLFNSFQYLWFLPCVLLLYWLSPARLRNFILLISCYVFYMSWKPVYGLLIFGLTLVNYLMGWLISKTTERRKLVLIAAIAINLITLAFFKYTYFFRDLASSIGSGIGAHVPPIEWKIILPLGISFFVFEFIHYVVDVYRGSKPIKSFWDFALFASFFPTQIAGPIKRYQDFMPQIAPDVGGRADKSRPYMDMVQQSVYWIILGLIKKVLFADNLGVVVHSAFEHPELLSSLDLWLAVYAFAFQIYFDFSGYTDIARGSALLLGFKVPPNFNLPYLSSSISEFWKRWHMSLSTWLRDYLYIPLGGNKGNRFFTYRNLMLTMILGGIWHGAAVHFAIWGFYQGLLLVAHKEFKHWTDKVTWFYQMKQSQIFHLFSIVLTFHAVCLGWVFFRAENLSSAMLIIKRLLFLSQLATTQMHIAIRPFALTILNAKESVVFLLLPIMLALLVLGQLLSSSKLNEMSLLKKKWIAAAALAVSICLLVIFSPDYAPQFIYFQF
jgi:alginate O-acetyltransferase complex protein AlgI